MSKPPLKRKRKFIFKNDQTSSSAKMMNLGSCCESNEEDAFVFSNKKATINDGKDLQLFTDVALKGLSLNIFLDAF